MAAKKNRSLMVAHNQAFNSVSLQRPYASQTLYPLQSAALASRLGLA